MLKKLLSREECAKCRICCCFDSSDIWEAPVIDSEKSQQITKDFRSDQEFVEKDGHYLLKMKKSQTVTFITALFWIMKRAA